jgi:hypothetical protein
VSRLSEPVLWWCVGANKKRAGAAPAHLSTGPSRSASPVYPLLPTLGRPFRAIPLGAVFPGLKPMGYSVFALRATQNVQTCRQHDSILLESLRKDGRRTTTIRATSSLLASVQISLLASVRRQKTKPAQSHTLKRKFVEGPSRNASPVYPLLPLLAFVQISFAYVCPPSKTKPTERHTLKRKICRRTIPKRQSRLPFVTFACFCSNSLCFLLSAMKPRLTSK